MSATENAIKDAIKGGYQSHDALSFLSGLPEYAKAQIWIDPEFWQALGKAREWRQHENTTAKDKVLGRYGPEWRVQWHRFIDHLAEGKDIETFFANV